jgi:two-component system, cell cycle sensor histidine kinase and response regulator CckA
MTEISDHTLTEIMRRSFEAAPSALLLVDSEGQIVLVNEQAERLFGYTSGELRGQVVELVVPSAVRELHAGLRDGYFGHPQTHLHGHGRELQAQHKNGAIFPVEIGLSPLRVESGVLVLSSIVDITERKRLEADLRESEERFRVMADSAPVMLWMAGPDQLCTFFNKRWLAFTGRKMEDALGVGCASSIHPDDLEHCTECRSAAARERREFRLEYRLRRADGEYRWVLENGAPRFSQSGRFAGFICSCTDITDMKRLQEEALARQKLESIGVLAGGIAHDFNNLLGSILADAELALLDLTGNSACAEEVGRIRAVAIRASEIVRELMIYAGQEKANPQPVDLSLLVMEMLQLLKTSINKRATLKMDLGHAHATIRADAAELRQLVMNLILNASDAIEGDHGEIRVTTSHLTLSPRAAAAPGVDLPPGDYVRLEVADTGRGMTPAELSKIFAPFFTTKLAGRGLGLCVVQRIVQRYGGSIKATSQPGFGTQFAVLLPCTAEAAPADRSAPRSDVNERSSPVTGTVLMVEDEEGLRLAVSQMLRKQGFQVLEAADGAMALKLFRRRSREIGAILLDMTLPGISSHEVIAEVSRRRPDIRVILTTAYSRETAAPAFKAPQVKGFIRKPYQTSELVTLLRDVLSASDETLGTTAAISH